MMQLNTGQLVILVDWLCVVPGWLFVILYAIPDRWRYTVYGRHMMSFIASITMLLSLSIYKYYFDSNGNLPVGLEVVRYLVGLNFAWVVWRNLFLLAKAQRDRTSEQTAVKPQERATEYE